MVCGEDSYVGCVWLAHAHVVHIVLEPEMKGEIEGKKGVYTVAVCDCVFLLYDFFLLLILLLLSTLQSLISPT